MAVKYKLQDLPNLSDKKIFVDANVLIYLFWPTGANHWERNYASALARLLKQGNQMLIDFCVLSEVVNHMMRIEHNKLQTMAPYKDFRDSQEGRDALLDIYFIVKEHILKIFNIVGKIYGQKEIENFLIVDELDFVDKSIINICKENDFVLLTNDKDFRDTDIDILTDNIHLLD